MDEDSTDTDALPTPRRTGVLSVGPDSPDESIQQNTTEERDRQQINDNHPRTIVKIPKPPDDWKFNNLLDEIAAVVSGDQLERFKGLFRGHGRGSIGKNSLGNCKTCVQLFHLLREREYISRDNLLYLQKLLLLLDNRELIEKAIDYCRGEGHLHFYKATEEPEPGSRYVKFHLEGNDLREFRQDKLREIRDTVAHILCISPENVVVVGVGPSSSLCVTLMIPETYVAIFKAMLEQKRPFNQLCKLNIDVIYIDEKAYNITGVEDVELVETEQQRKITEIYDQLEEKTSYLENAEEKIRTLSKALDAANSSLVKEKADRMSLDLELNALEAMHNTALCEKEVTEFRKQLQQADIPDTLREPVKSILKSNTEMVSIYTRKQNENEIKKLKIDLNDHEEKLLDLERQLEVHRYLSYRSNSEVNLLQTMRLCMKDVPLEQFERIVDIIKAVSKDLTDAEKTEIQLEFEWDSIDQIKEDMEHSESLFLFGIICEEYKRTSSVVDIESVISIALNKVKRNDLLEEFKGKIKEMHSTQHSEIEMHSTQHSEIIQIMHTTFSQYFADAVSGPLRYPRLTYPTYPRLQHSIGGMHPFNIIEMATRPFRFVLRSVQTLHIF